MSRVIVEIRNPEDDSDRRLMMWCTIVDAPATFGMTRAQFAAWYQDDTELSEDLAGRMARVDAWGTSARGAYSWLDIAGANRAGANEACLDAAGLWRHYVLDAPEDVTVPCSLPEAGGAL